MTGLPASRVPSFPVSPTSPPSPLQRLTSLLDDLVERGITPGGVAAIALPGGVAWEHAFGLRALVPEPEPCSADTLYDVASVTKPLITAALWLDARARGLVRFEQGIDELVPEMAAATGQPRPPTIGELLLHAGGLPSWAPLYALVEGGLAERARWLGTHRGEPGRRAVYGCPGYQVLGLALERLHGEPLRRLAQERVLRGVDGAQLGPLPPELKARAAPTEEGNARERAMAVEAAEEASAYAGFRDGLIRGDVHDHDAFTAGGCAGNAGLFATARAAAELCARYLRPDDAFSRDDLAELSRDLAPHEEPEGEQRTWGFQLARSRSSPAGDAASDRAFGHAGFTGTSVLIDPDRGAAFVLLTNRIHPRFVDVPFHAERRRFHDAAAAAVGELRG